MNEIIAQAAALDAKWIITGLGGAFLVFATWVGKFIKQVWTDIKIMHANQIQTLESVIGKQEISTGEIKDQQAEILTHTKEIEEQVKEVKFSIKALEEEFLN
jgi:septal ring factor EnvC (AmiA/AmiB activator)